MFGLQPNADISMDELKSRYKYLAMKHHPDKGGSEESFRFLTICFKKIYHELKSKEIDRQFIDLKSASQSFLGKQSDHHIHRSSSSSSVSPEPYGNESFSDKFNKMFDEYQLVDDVNAQGYGHIMAPSSKEREEISIERNNRIKNNKSFHKEFDRVAKPPPKDMVLYKEPEALPSSTRVPFSELGVDKIDDFSGENNTLHKLNYMDYKRAHDVSRLVDPSMIKKRRKYASVDALEAERESISYQMTPEEVARDARRQLKEKKHEEMRVRKQQELDQKIENHYHTVLNRLQHNLSTK
jgi:curved DNA-binding protein CbpA